MISNSTISADISFYTELRKRCLKRLRNMPSENIYFKMQHGKYRPYVYSHSKQIYLNSSKQKYINQLLNKRELKESIKRIDHNLKMLSKLKDNYFDPTSAIPAQFNLEQHRALTDVISELESRRSGKEGYENKHTTSDGTEVKSKSELLLYELFKSEHITFYYEKSMQIEDSLWYADFTLVRNLDGKIFPWEHFGMMNNMEYASIANHKMYKYALNGYKPFDNIIYTFDDYDGGIDMEKMVAILRMMKFIA